MWSTVKRRTLPARPGCGFTGIILLYAGKDLCEQPFVVVYWIVFKAFRKCVSHLLLYYAFLYMNFATCSLCKEQGHAATKCPDLIDPLKPGFSGAGNSGGGHSHDEDEKLLLFITKEKKRWSKDFYISKTNDIKNSLLFLDGFQ